MSAVASSNVVFSNGREVDLTIKADLPINDVRNAINHGDKKELCQSWKVSALSVVNGRPSIAEIIDLRIYAAKSKNASTVYASIWVHDGESNRYTSGNGKASGWGYHKGSAAVAGAIESAGIRLWGSAYSSRPSSEIDYSRGADIGGVGESAIEYALLAIAVALGHRDVSISRVG